MYAMSMEGRDEKESSEFLNELHAPLDPEQRAAEKRWLMKGG